MDRSFENNILGSDGTSYPTPPISTLMYLFFAFSHFEGKSRPLKMNDYLKKLLKVVRLDQIYRMVPRLIRFDIYFLRYGP
jgi:hypothetical protein